MTHTEKRGLSALLFALAALLAGGLTVLWSMFHMELATLRTLEQVDGKAFYTMTYQGDYGFDDFLAQGGAASDGEVISFVVDRILKGIPLDFELPDLGCSTLFVEQEGGGYLFGRNFDMYDSPAVLLTTTPDDGYRSLSMVNLGYLGYDSQNLPDGLMSSVTTLAGPYAPIDGMNEKGLCVSVMLIDTDCTNQDNGLPDITTTTAMRLMLDKAATVDEAVDLLRRYDMHSSAGSCYHFEIADATGQVAVVEYVENEMSVVNSHYSTNFLLTEGNWQGFGSGHDRFEILETAYQTSGGVMSADQLMDVMASAAQAPDSSKHPTQWSCVYDPQALTVTVCYKTDYENAYTFSLNQG